MNSWWLLDSSHLCLMVKVTTGHKLFLMLTETKQTYFEIRHSSLKSCDQFLIFDPSTWPQEERDLHSFGNNS